MKKLSVGTIASLVGAAIAGVMFLGLDSAIRFSGFLAAPPCWLTHAAHCVR